MTYLKTTVLTFFTITNLFLMGAANAKDGNYYFHLNPNIKAGITAMKNEEWSKASIHLKKAVKINLDKELKGKLFNNLCAVELKRAALESARKACDAAIRLDRSNWRALANRSSIFSVLGEYRKAEKDLARAASLKPNAPIIATLRASLEKRNEPKLATK